MPHPMAHSSCRYLSSERDRDRRSHACASDAFVSLYCSYSGSYPPSCKPDRFTQKETDRGFGSSVRIFFRWSLLPGRALLAGVPFAIRITATCIKLCGGWLALRSPHASLHRPLALAPLVLFALRSPPRAQHAHAIRCVGCHFSFGPPRAGAS
jgi:hypothetical protein